MVGDGINDVLAFVVADVGVVIVLMLSDVVVSVVDVLLFIKDEGGIF